MNKRKMSKKLFGLVAVLVTLATTHSAIGMGGEYGKGDPQHPQWNPQWPTGVKELVNREDRVGGYWVNSFDWYYFAGDANSFNTFLEQYSKLHDTPLTLIIHAGKATTTGIGTQEIPPSDWHVNVINNSWAQKDNAWSREAKRTNTLPKTAYTVTVNLWLGGEVELTDVKVPANIEVKSGDEIENFIAQQKTKK